MRYSPNSWRVPKTVIVILLSLWLVPLAIGVRPDSGTIHIPQVRTEGTALARNSLESNSSPIQELSIPQNNSDPVAITTDDNGTVWFAETNPGSIVSYNPATQVFKAFPIPTTNNSGLIWFLIIDGNYLWFSCGNLPYLWSFSLVNYHFSNFSTGNPEIIPFSLALDSKSGQIWFTSIYTDQIGAFNVDSPGIATLATMVNLTAPSIVSAGAGPKYGPSGITVDSAGDLFITETFASSIVEYSPTTQSFVKFWKLQSGSQPVGITVNDSSSDIWFTNHGSSQIGEINENNSTINYFTTSLISYNNSGSSGSYENSLPYWIQQSPSGAIWFDEHIGNKITRFNSSSDALTEFIIPTPDSSPLRFTLDNLDGEVWFTEFQGNKLGMLDENQTCNCNVDVFPRETALNGQSINFTFTDNTLETSVNSDPPLVSGSLSSVGNITPNLTTTYTSVNSDQYLVIVKRGPDLARGNFSLTFCENDNNSLVRQCSISFVSASNSPTVYSATNDFVIAIVVGAVAVLSLAYVSRWRNRKAR